MANLDELSFSTRWKAKVQRAKVGPSKKAVPSYLRTTGKKANPSLVRTDKGISLKDPDRKSPSQDYERYKKEKKRRGDSNVLSFQDWIKRNG